MQENQSSQFTSIELMIQELRQSVDKKKQKLPQVWIDDLIGELQDKVAKITRKEEDRLNQPLLEILAKVDTIEKRFKENKNFQGLSQQEKMMKRELINIEFELDDISPQPRHLDKRCSIQGENAILIEFTYKKAADIFSNKRCTPLKLEDVKNLNLQEEVPQKHPTSYLITRLGKFNTDRLVYYRDPLTLEPILEQAALQLRDSLYLLGGKRELIYQKSLIKKDEEGNYRRCEDMSSERSCVGLGGIKNILIAAGGESYDCALNEVQKYNTSTNSWSGFASLLHERKWPGICCFFDKVSSILDIYCFCGQGKKKLKSIEKYDGVQAKWTKIEREDGVVTNYNLKALSFKNDILVFGGHRMGEGEVRSMYRFQKNGKIKEKLCENGYLPIEQGAEPHYKDIYERVFTVARADSKEHIWMFDGREWIRVI